jgi:isopenicillin N synthase-like dioxygenase
MVVPLATREQLPIIDISPLYNNDNPQQQAAVAATIRSACLNTGFFYVSGQCLPQTGPIFRCMQQLFDLPDSSKEKLDANLSPLHRGYTGLGGAHNCVPDETAAKGPDNKESFLLGKCTSHACSRPLHSLLCTR